MLLEELMIFHKWVKIKDFETEYHYICASDDCGYFAIKVGRKNSHFCKKHYKEFWQIEETIILKWLRRKFGNKSSNKLQELPPPEKPYTTGQWMS